MAHQTGIRGETRTLPPYTPSHTPTPSAVPIPPSPSLRPHPSVPIPPSPSLRPRRFAGERFSPAGQHVAPPGHSAAFPLLGVAAARTSSVLLVEESTRTRHHSQARSAVVVSVQSCYPYMEKKKWIQVCNRASCTSSIQHLPIMGFFRDGCSVFLGIFSSLLYG